MEEFAEYILNEEDLIAKEEIIYFLAPKLGINFDKATIFKTEIARMFLKYTKIRLDHNLILTACLLCNCKKVDDAQKIGKVQTYAIEGAQLLKKLGFDARFCKICEGVNRYSEQERREPESDILELVDQFGGMLLDRPERIGLNPDEALVLLEHRNLKNEYNRYLDTFMNFVDFIEKINMSGVTSMPALKRLYKIHNESSNVIDFIKEVVYSYEPKLDKLIEKQIDKLANDMFEDVENPNRPLFSEETAKRVMSHIKEEVVEIKK